MPQPRHVLSISRFYLAAGLFAALCMSTVHGQVALEDLTVLTWQQRAPGVWSAQIGATDTPRLLDYVAAPPAMSALEKLGEVSFPLPQAGIRGQVYKNRTSARLPLGEAEKLYGFGLQFKGMNHRSDVIHLKMDHYGGTTGMTHAPVPFYVSSAGYGVLFNTARHISVHAGIGNRKDSPNLPPIRNRNTDSDWQARPTSDAVEASVQAPGMEVYVFAGPTPLDAVRRYNLYSGGGALPPRWGLGFWHRVPLNASDTEVASEIESFFSRDFPIEVVGLEPGWQSKSYPGTLDWNSEHFPEPAAFIAGMAERGVHVNLWENPYVSPESSLYEGLLPYTGSHTVWLGVVPDYTIDAARHIYSDHHKTRHLDVGVSGYKIDEVDGIDAWLWPDHAVFPSGLDGEQMRQIYGLNLQKMMTALYRERNQRTYGLVRGTNAGGTGYPFVVYSDYYDHRGYVTALCNSGFSGLLWTPEIRSASSDEEWVRRMQTVCFSPLAMLNAWASGTKPWSRPEVEDAIREVMQLRMRLVPYLYSAFARYHFDGTPPFRPMALVEGFLEGERTEAGTLDDVSNPYAEAVRKGVTDQYLMGDSILVAPLFAKETKRSVVLPRGKWYDFYTGDYVGGGEVIEVEAALDVLPLYVRNGGIIPLAPVAANSKALGEGYPLEVRHYGDAPGTMMLYDDDGTTFDYEKGAYNWYALTVYRNDTSQLEGNGIRMIDGYNTRSFGDTIFRFMTE